MINYFSIALTHALIALAAWRLLSRDDLDVEPETSCDEETAGNSVGEKRPWLANQKYLGRRNDG